MSERGISYVDFSMLFLTKQSIFRHEMRKKEARKMWEKLKTQKKKF